MLIPFLLNLATLPIWARYLDRVHVAQFRAQQNALWVVGILVMFLGACSCRCSGWCSAAS